MAMTTAAIVGAGIQGAGAVISFAEAQKQREAAAKAEKASKLYIEEAAKQIEKDEYAALNVPLDAFTEQYRQNVRLEQQGIEALQEGDPRNLAAGLGNVVGNSTANNEKTRIQMGEALYDNAKMKADSRESIKQDGIDLLTGQASDESMRSRDAEENKAAYMTQGMNALGSVGTTLFEGSNLYSTDRGAQEDLLLKSVDTSLYPDLDAEGILAQLSLLTPAEKKLAMANGGLPQDFATRIKQ